MADSADTATTANFAEWLDSQIEDIYNQYLSGDKFATDADDGAEGFGRRRKLTRTHPTKRQRLFDDEILR